jgi:hypothetical protein
MPKDTEISPRDIEKEPEKTVNGKNEKKKRAFRKLKGP